MSCCPVKRHLEREKGGGEKGEKDRGEKGRKNKGNLEKEREGEKRGVDRRMGGREAQ